MRESESSRLFNHVRASFTGKSSVRNSWSRDDPDTIKLILACNGCFGREICSASFAISVETVLDTLPAVSQFDLLLADREQWLPTQSTAPARLAEKHHRVDESLLPKMRDGHCFFGHQQSTNIRPWQFFWRTLFMGNDSASRAKGLDDPRQQHAH